MQICIVSIITGCLVLLDLQHESTVYSPSMCMAGIVAIQAVLIFSGLHVVRQTQIDNAMMGQAPTNRKSEVGKHLDFRLTLHFALWVGGVLLTMTCFQWPQLCMVYSVNTFSARILVLLPAIASLLCSWAILYSAECEVDPSLRDLGRWHFVQGQSRLFLMLPLGLILLVVGCQDAADSLSQEIQRTTAVHCLRVAPLVAIAALFPLLLRVAWKTESLAAGPLRERLEGQCQRLAFKKRDILVWNTDQRMRNAAISGILPRWRYILLSDRLLRDLPAEYVESIFLHEIGHARHHHHLKLIGLTVLMLCAGMAHVMSGSLIVGIVGMLAGMGLVCRFAKLLELQADLWAAHRAEDFPFEYLNAIASVSQGSVDQRGWLHPSFQQRVDFLLLGSKADQRLNLLFVLHLLAATVLGIALLAAILAG